MGVNKMENGALKMIGGCLAAPYHLQSPSDVVVTRTGLEPMLPP